MQVIEKIVLTLAIRNQNIDSKINVKTNSPSFSSMFIAEFMEFDAKRHKA